MHIKKKPDRKPLPKEDAVYGKCGNRCDLCIHYDKISEEFRNKLVPHLSVVYNTSDFTMRCSGCDTKGCHCHVSNELCPPLKCIHQNELKSCFDCKKYPCETAIVGYRQLECKSISADDVTWGILPYVPNQYETK